MQCWSQSRYTFCRAAGAVLLWRQQLQIHYCILHTLAGYDKLLIATCSTVLCLLFEVELCPAGEHRHLVTNKKQYSKNSQAAAAAVQELRKTMYPTPLPCSNSCTLTGDKLIRIVCPGFKLKSDAAAASPSAAVSPSCPSVDKCCLLNCCLICSASCLRRRYWR